MEEIRDARALEQEILDDARKKAERIVRTRDKSIAEVRKRWGETTNQRLEEINREHQERVAQIELQNSSALPLERKREFLTFAEDRLLEAISQYFRELASDRLRTLFVRYLAPAGHVIGTAPVAVTFSGMGEDDARKIVQSGLPDAGIESVDAEDGARPSVTIATHGNDIILKCSIDRIEQELLSNHRDALANALFAGRVSP